MLRGGATSYYHADGLGSITSLSNAAGSIANTYTYDSFGKLTNSTGSLVNPFRYTARESDTETGLYFYRARYYDPSLGRFLSADEVGNDDGMNLYPYVGNSPIGSRDPTGFYKLKGFPADLEQQMKDAIKSAIQVLNASTCSGCAGPDAPKIVKALKSATFIYKPDLSAFGHLICGEAPPDKPKTILVGSKAFGKECCRLDSTLAHEATHMVSGPGDFGLNGPLAVEERCFGCN